MLDKITYTKKGDDFEKVITQERVVIAQDLEREKEALEAQLSDFNDGKTDTPEDQKTIDDAIANYEEQLIILAQ